MKRRVRCVVALSSALAALATGGACWAQDLPVVEVPLVAGAPLQFHALSAPPAPMALQRMVQDRYGFLWLSASDGLRRYDGHGFMKVPEGESAHGVGHMIGHSLMTDRAGQLWIGADDALHRYDPATGSFRQYRSPNKDCGTVAVAHDIVEDPDGTMWLATDDGGDGARPDHVEDDLPSPALHTFGRRDTRHRDGRHERRCPVDHQQRGALHA